MNKHRLHWSLISLFLVALVTSTIGCITITAPGGEEQGAGPSSAFLTYVDDINGFSISYPSIWVRQPDVPEGGVVAFAAPADAGQSTGASFLVMRVESPAEMSLQSKYDSMKADLEPLPGFSVVSEQDIIIDGIPSKKLIFTHTENGLPTKSMKVLLMKGKVTWSIILTSLPESFSSLEPTFDSIANSFHLMEAAGTASGRPKVNSFTASPETISYGQSVTLSWAVSGATTVAINPVVGTVSSSGSAQVDPTQTTTYTLTATHEGWTTTSSITVTVTSAVTGKADLIITDIWLTGTQIYYKIKNQGDLNAKPSKSYLYINGIKVASDIVENLAVGQEITALFSGYNYARPAADVVTVKICSDVDNDIDEGDEGNNCRVGNWGFLYTYDFTKKSHLASWRSEAGELKWPMVAGDKKGAAFVIHSARLEDDKTYSPGLSMYPEQTSYGWIQGRFADYYTDKFSQPRSRQIVIPEKVKFTAQVGFRKGAEASDGVAVALGYVDSTGSIQLFQKMDVYYDGTIDTYEVDLSAMAGEKTEFILWVEAKDTWDDDWLVWVEPRIVQEQ